MVSERCAPPIEYAQRAYENEQFMNVFLIGSPLQLINAIEAKHSFDFQDNLLILLLGLGYSNESEIYKRLLQSEQWNCVIYLRLHPDHLATPLGSCRSPVTGRFWKYQRLLAQHSDRRELDSIAQSLPKAENLILGNYLQEGELYMRHFAAGLKHNNLYLVDDGTDVLLVNGARKSKRSSGADIRPAVGLSPWKRFKQKVRTKFIDWNDYEADKVTFFTAYDLDVRPGDQVVKNDYSFLRAKSVRGIPRDYSLVLGQSLIEDGYISGDIYYDYLGKVQRYLDGQEIIYVPHPRESCRTVSYVTQHLKWRTQKFDIPIEMYLAGASERPRALASFCCSALLNCALLCRGDVDIKAFYIEPLHLLRNREFIETLYGHFEREAKNNLDVVRLN